jgi:hypothetical protein
MKIASRPIIIGNDQTAELIPVVDANGDCVDMSSWTIVFVVRATPTGSTLLSITASVSGTYNADPAVNTQKATAIIADTDTDGLTAGLRFYAWKRTDSGSETDLDYGLIRVVNTASS